MVESTVKPSDIILKFLKEIVESWENKRYEKVAEQCTALLKRRKTIENLGMTFPLQRILLQAHLLQDQYDKVIDWEKTGSSLNTTNTARGSEDLVLYARYRSGDYAGVSKQSAEALALGNDKNNTVLMKNLQAQSNFHLNRTEEGLTAYLKLLSNDSIDDDDVESKMEVLTNALALIASSGCTPMVNLEDEFWLEEAEAMLLRDDESVDSMFSDLASNLGCIRFLTDPAKGAAIGSTHNWLEEAADTGETDDTKKGTLEQINLQWSKHFWYKAIEDVQYDVSKSNSNNSNKMSVTESIVNVNQSLLDENLTRLPSQTHSKWNLLQVRMYWYDRAILQLKAGQYVECHDSCQSLKKTLSSTVASQTINKKKKKSKDETSAGSSPPGNPTALWWEARADVILAHAQRAQSKYKEAVERLDRRLDALKTSPLSSVIDHAVTHVSLHRFVIEKQQEKGVKKDRQRQQRELLTLLSSLPESIQSRPATQLTMDDLNDAVNNSNTNIKTKNTPKSPLEEADMLFGEGQFEEACKLYENTLSGSNISSSTLINSQLRYVQALAMTERHEESQDLWQSLDQAVEKENIPATSSLPAGVSLENKTLPRTTTDGTKSSITNKIATTSNTRDEDNSSKRSREKILRRRVVKKEAHLKELESKGKYNPDRPIKPDPERWIPKHERSRSSRGGNRGGRNKNNGLNSAQGGGSKLDADRLDAAARRAGKIPASNGPSSANLKVSSGGRKGGRRR
eukprot:CAMPEP_0197188736 /NCGR_PEP_ID=MMETSP1423-20130617/18379_1 /TAXON_ID=476441 /ORGANISM="Pseudo-nitzschia heimii, Strain UNC1101" /LENGTH=739 /DNA_ID=CAMNT_0042640659 /DNA_START=235 /DNA_END=2454 /DNA_ORIENTATION=+